MTSLVPAQFKDNGHGRSNSESNSTHLVDPGKESKDPLGSTVEYEASQEERVIGEGEGEDDQVLADPPGQPGPEPPFRRPQPSIRFEDPLKGEPLCYYVLHIFKVLLLRGCPLKLLSQFTGLHVNTLRKLRDETLGDIRRQRLNDPSIPDICFIKADLRRRPHKALTSLNWTFKLERELEDLVKWCESQGHKDPRVCYAFANEFEPSLPCKYVSIPYPGASTPGSNVSPIETRDIASYSQGTNQDPDLGEKADKQDTDKLERWIID